VLLPAEVSTEGRSATEAPRGSASDTTSRKPAGLLRSEIFSAAGRAASAFTGGRSAGGKRADGVDRPTAGDRGTRGTTEADALLPALL